MKRLYLDTAAGTSPNPGSLHREGVLAKKTLEAARKTAASLLSARPDEIIFTSGGTEGNNLAILGVPAGEVIVSAIEHPSVLVPAEARVKTGRGQMLLAPVDEGGVVKMAELKKLISLTTVLISVMYANNEIGTIEPIAEIAKLVRWARKEFNQPTPYLHIDACQAPRFLPLNVQKLGVDLMTINSGKIYGPRGIGLLFKRRGVKLTPQLLGGEQEAGYRSGTENHLLARDFVQALVLADKLKDKESQQLSKLRDHFIAQVIKEIPDAILNGSVHNRLPNNVNFSFPGVVAEQVIIELDSQCIAASTGSACSLPKHNSSYVIMALGKSAELARSAVRFSFPRGLTKSDVNYTIKTLKKIISNLRQNNYAYATDLALWLQRLRAGAWWGDNEVASH